MFARRAPGRAPRRAAARRAEFLRINMAIKCLHRTHPPHHRTSTAPRRARARAGCGVRFCGSATVSRERRARETRDGYATRPTRRHVRRRSHTAHWMRCDDMRGSGPPSRVAPTASRAPAARACARPNATHTGHPSGAIVTSVKRSHRTGWPQAGGWPASDLARQSSGAQWRPPALCGGERDEAPPPTPATDTPPSRTHTDTPPSRTHTLPPHGVRLIGHAPTARANRTHTRARVQITRDIRPHNAAHTHTQQSYAHTRTRTHACTAIATTRRHPNVIRTSRRASYTLSHALELPWLGGGMVVAGSKPVDAAVPANPPTTAGLSPAASPRTVASSSLGAPPPAASNILGLPSPRRPL